MRPRGGPGASLGRNAANRGTHGVLSGLQLVQVDPRIGLVCLAVFNTSRSMGLWGVWGGGDEGALWTPVELALRCKSRPHPCFLPLSPACVTHTNGNNFFRLLADVGEAGSLRHEGASVSCPTWLCAGWDGLLNLPHSHAQFLFPPLPLLGLGVGLAFSILCFGVSFSSATLYHLSWSCCVVGTCL